VRATIPKKKGGKNMKKGLFLTLVLSIALIASSSFGYAPEIGNIPDVVIGNCDESGNFWTTDVKMFRFSNAFKFDDYVTDNDSTPSTDLKWCFIEQVSGYLAINDKLELDTGSEDPYAPPGAKELRAGNEYASFRDIMASPPSFDAAVQSGTEKYPGAPLCDQFVTFWVVDQDSNADSKTIYVKSIDCEVDALSAGAEFVGSYGFDTDSETFAAATFTGYSLPTSRQEAGRIGLQTGGAAANVFGFWQTPSDEIAYQANRVFRARYSLQRDTALTNADDMPSMRLRWITNNFAGSASYYINSISPFDMVPPVEPSEKDYTSYFYPATDTGGLGLTIDVLDFSPEGGTVWCTGIEVEKIDRSFLNSTAVKTYDTDFNTWSFNPNFGAFGNVTSTGSTANELVLISTVADAANAGFHQSPANDMAYATTPQLYRAAFDVKRAGADAMAVPAIRLRAFNEDNQIVAEYNINHGNAPGPGSPPQTAKTFEVYWDTPTLPASPTTDQDGFRVAFDMLDFSNLEGDTITLEKVAIEYNPIPPDVSP
jgi:hypothetical protein